VRHRGADVAAVLTPDRSRLADEAYAELRRYIIDGSLPPGAHLVEQSLAKALAVSRTPLREGLRRLEQEGLLERQAGGGLRVVELNGEGIDELMGIRSVLEGYCARLAAERASDEELTAIAEAHADGGRAIKAGDLSAVVAANTRFHDGINAAGHAPRCMAMVSQNRDWVLRYRSQVLVDVDRRKQSYREHEKVLVALKAHDSASAEQLMRDHIIAVGQQIIAALKEQQ
jgi:DNA-binding GntR family transcriptional regulator